MDIINTPYWILEFLKVLFGFLLLGFAWPRFVFAGHLRGKSLIYQFGFCVTTQVVLVNTVVLCLGLFHILNVWTVRAIFYGIPLALLVKRLNLTEEQAVAAARAEVFTRPRLMLKRLRHTLARKLREAWRRVRPHWLEFLALAAVAVYALVYFSWGSFQTAVYGYGDLYVHHSWIYGLIQGEIFADGIYPEGMHCFLYAINVLLGTEVYSLVLFFGGIQCVLFLAAAYCLLREFFHWRFTPVFVLAAYVLYRWGSVHEMRGLARLQWTLPLEFALAPQMLCVLYLLRYLRSDKQPVEKGIFSGYVIGDELLVFMMALASLLVIHFHPVMKAFFMCLVVVIFHIKKIFSKKRFLPLVGALLCGVLIAVAPMLAGLASGIPPQASIDWAIGIIDGKDDTERREALDMAEDEDALSFTINVLQTSCSEVTDGSISTVAFCVLNTLIAVGLMLRLGLWFLPSKMRERLKNTELVQTWLRKYLLVAATALSMLAIYAAPYLGLPELIVAARVVATVRMLLFAVLAVPLDVLFYLFGLRARRPVLYAASAVCFAALCGWVVKTHYHGYLYCELTRYRAEIETMNSIVQDYPKFSYTVVSPTDGLYHVIEHGRHEELLDFIKCTEEDRYFIPTEYVFIFVEKKPLEYAQNHFSQGPSWIAEPTGQEQHALHALGWSTAPEILATQISLEAARQELEEFTKPFDCYRFSRTEVESRVYYWCQRFKELYPGEIKVYYEDEEFVCYYFQQEPEAPYDLSIGEYVP